MEKEFIPSDLTLRLKTLGFNEPCFGYRDGADRIMIKEMPHCFTSAPTFSQAFRWFREKYGYYCDLFVDDDKTFGFLISYFIEIGRADKPIQRKYTTYEDAESACLDKLIEIVESNLK